MRISVEISYYSLRDDYREPVELLLKTLTAAENVEIETGSMSSVIWGDYDGVMNLLQRSLKPLMERFPSLFVLKISNSCG